VSRGNSQGKSLEDVTSSLEKILKKNSQNPLTSPTGCGTMIVSSREEHNNRRRKTPRNQKGIAL
jgi:hypothetical protein